MMPLEEASARYERAHAELTAAADNLRRVMLAAAGAPGADPSTTILFVVARHFGVKPEDIVGLRRLSSLVLPRHVAMAITRRLTRRTLEQVGAQFGREHGTVVWAERNIAARCQTEPQFKREYEQLIARCEAEIGKEAVA